MYFKKINKFAMLIIILVILMFISLGTLITINYRSAINVTSDDNQNKFEDNIQNTKYRYVDFSNELSDNINENYNYFTEIKPIDSLKKIAKIIKNWDDQNMHSIIKNKLLYSIAKHENININSIHNLKFKITKYTLFLSTILITWTNSNKNNYYYSNVTISV